MFAARGGWLCSLRTSKILQRCATRHNSRCLTAMIAIAQSGQRLCTYGCHGLFCLIESDGHPGSQIVAAVAPVIAEYRRSTVRHRRPDNSTPARETAQMATNGLGKGFGVITLPLRPVYRQVGQPDFHR